MVNRRRRLKAAQRGILFDGYSCSGERHCKYAWLTPLTCCSRHVMMPDMSHCLDTHPEKSSSTIVTFPALLHSFHHFRHAHIIVFTPLPPPRRLKAFIWQWMSLHYLGRISSIDLCWRERRYCVIMLIFMPAENGRRQFIDGITPCKGQVKKNENGCQKVSWHIDRKGLSAKRRHSSSHVISSGWKRRKQLRAEIYFHSSGKQDGWHVTNGFLWRSSRRRGRHRKILFWQCCSC